MEDGESSQAWRDGFRKRLVSCMAERGLTVRELAEMCGLPPSSLQALRSGGLTTDYEALKRLAAIFNLTLDDLLFGEQGSASPSPREVKISGELTITLRLAPPEASGKG